MRPFAAVGMILVLSGFLFTSCSSKSRRERATFGTTPQRISLEALTERGSAGPRNVILTDYRLCRNYVVEQRIGKGPGGQVETRWLRAYIPVVRSPEPGDGFLAEIDPRDIRIVIHCPDVSDEKELLRRCGGPELQGLVVGTMTDLSGEEQRLLKEKYPETDPARCIVIKEGAVVEAVGDPNTVRTVGLVLMGLGGALLAVAAVLFSDRRAVRVERGTLPPPATDGGWDTPTGAPH